MTSDDGQDSIHRFGLTYALDPDGFFRRTCPSCGREFKVKAPPEDIAFSLQPAFSEIGLEIGETTMGQSEDDENEKSVYCPYCGHKAEQSETLPEELVLYVKRWAMREFVLPQLRQMTAELERTFSSSHLRSGGLFSISVTFKGDDSTLPPRPIAGPEQPDMKRVCLLCCHTEMKVLDSWLATVICPSCGTEAALQ